MGHLVVLASPPLADGFRLAGALVLEAAPGPGCEAALSAAVASPDAALVAVTADLWDAIPDRARGEVEALGRPVVVPVPGPVSPAGPDPASRRRLIADAVRRAIGHRVEVSAVGGAR